MIWPMSWWLWLILGLGAVPICLYIVGRWVYHDGRRYRLR